MNWPWSSDAPEPESSWTEDAEDGSKGAMSGAGAGRLRERDFEEIESRAQALEEALEDSIGEAEAKLANLEERRRRILQDIQQARDRGDAQREDHAKWEHHQVLERKDTWLTHLANQKKLLHEHLHRKDIVRVRELEGRISGALEDVEDLIQEKAPELATQEGLGAGREKLRRTHKRLESGKTASTLDEVSQQDRERNEEAIEDGLARLDDGEGR